MPRFGRGDDNRKLGRPTSSRKVHPTELAGTLLLKANLGGKPINWKEIKTWHDLPSSLIQAIARQHGVSPDSPEFQHALQDALNTLRNA